jgi:transcriptional regulator with XRE-family HTH domain
MSFGKWLVEKRQAAGFTQAQLAERVGISPNYISALERDAPNAKDGLPRRLRLGKVDKLAKVLRVSEDEARIAAGYAPTQLIGPPQNRRELLDALERIGVAHIEFHDDIDDKSPEQLQEIFDVIQIAVELTLTKQGKQ